MSDHIIKFISKKRCPYANEFFYLIIIHNSEKDRRPEPLVPHHVKLQVDPVSHCPVEDGLDIICAKFRGGGKGVCDVREAVTIEKTTNFFIHGLEKSIANDIYLG